jgi:hypothetical protein
MTTAFDSAAHQTQALVYQDLIRYRLCKVTLGAALKSAFFIGIVCSSRVEKNGRLPIKGLQLFTEVNSRCVSKPIVYQVEIEMVGSGEVEGKIFAIRGYNFTIAVGQ